MNCENKNSIPGYVYFRDNGMDYKFGITNNPTRRGRDYKTENPRDNILDCFFTTTYTEAEVIENEMKQVAKTEGLLAFGNSTEWIKRTKESMDFWNHFSKKYARRTYEEWVKIYNADKNPACHNMSMTNLVNNKDVSVRDLRLVLIERRLNPGTIRYWCDIKEKFHKYLYHQEKADTRSRKGITETTRHLPPVCSVPK